MRRSNSVYFPNLDGIRFIAALLVIINHVEQLSEAYGVKNYFDNDFIKSTGRLGVCLFFVLSGFLITFLLFKRRKTYHYNIIEMVLYQENIKDLAAVFSHYNIRSICLSIYSCPKITGS